MSLYSVQGDVALAPGLFRIGDGGPTGPGSFLIVRCADCGEETWLAVDADGGSGFHPRGVTELLVATAARMEHGLLTRSHHLGAPRLEERL